MPYEELPEIEDSELEDKLKNIDQGNLAALYEERVCPVCQRKQKTFES